MYSQRSMHSSFTKEAASFDPAAGAVVPGLLDAMSVCESKGDEADREVWRHRLFNYLDKAFGVGAAGSVCCQHLRLFGDPADLT